MTHRNVAFSLCHSPGLASASWAAGLVPGYRAGVWQQAQSLGDLEDMHTHVMGSQHLPHGVSTPTGRVGGEGRGTWLLAGTAQEPHSNVSITRVHPEQNPK